MPEEREDEIMTPMPKVIQDCHDRWANTLEGQLRIVAHDLESLFSIVKAEFPLFRYALRVRLWLDRLTRKRPKM